MPEDQAKPAPGWPHFDIARFPESSDFPRELAAPLLELGAPRTLLGSGYAVAGRLTLIEVPRFGSFVRFASEDSSNSMCLRPSTGQILVVIHAPNIQPFLVNSTLQQFIASAQFVINRFPFDDQVSAEHTDGDAHGDTSRWARATEELASGLRFIDPAALVAEGTYWSDFLDSVYMGNYSTDLVIGDA
jgi:SUKH-4 immunity protein of toxin-antitoxin system